MKIDLYTLGHKVEVAVPSVNATVFPEQNQIIVTFANRPDVEVALLTPWLQRQIRNGHISDEEFFDILSSIQRISNNK